jgi:peptidoglycan biosynthesis protein MviN/MurJ (putative lipid II flippase)
MKQLTKTEILVLVATATIATVLYEFSVPSTSTGISKLLVGVSSISSLILAVFYCMREQEMENLWNKCSNKFKDCAILGVIAAIMFLVMGADSILDQLIWGIAVCLTIGQTTSVIAYIVSLFIPKETWEKIEKILVPELPEDEK